MTLGEWREITATLDDETELFACSSLSDDLNSIMNISELITPDFYVDPIDESAKPIVICLFNDEKNIEDL